MKIDQITTNVVPHNWTKGYLNMENLDTHKSYSQLTLEGLCAFLFGKSEMRSIFPME